MSPWPHFDWEPPPNWKPVLGWTEPPSDPEALGLWLAKDFERCQRDIFYFTSNYGRVKDNDGAWHQFVLWESQRPAMRAFDTHRLVAALKARQLGVTWMCLHKMLQRGVFHSGSVQLIFSKGEREAKENLSKLRAAYHGLPPHLKTEFCDDESAHELKLPSGSTWKSFPTSAGDSYTAACALVDEADLIADLESLLSSVKPTIDNGGSLWLVSRSDKEHKKGPDSPFKRIYRAARDGQNNYFPVFLPWSAHPGRDQAWYEAQCRDALATERGMDFVHENYPATPEQSLAPGQSNKRIPIEWLDRCCQIERPMALETLYDVPGGSIASLPGLRVYRVPHAARRYVAGCLPDGQLVESEAGQVAIETVAVGDRLIDADGQPTPVVNVYRREYVGNVIEVLPFYSGSPTTFTPEHPIQVLADTKMYRRGPGKIRKRLTNVCWKTAGELSIGDVLRVPLPCRPEMTESALEALLGDQSGFRVDFRINPKVVKGEDFWFYVGFWLANGWTEAAGDGPDRRPDRSLVVSIHADQGSLIGKIESIAGSVFGRSPSLVNNRSKKSGPNNSVCIKFGCEALAKFLVGHFGKFAAGKRMPAWTLELPERLRLAMCHGYLCGDGCVTDDKGRESLEFVSVSKPLMAGLQDLLLSLGKLSSLSRLRREGRGEIRGRAFVQRETWHLRVAARESGELLSMLGYDGTSSGFERSRHTAYGWIEDRYAYLKIRSITRRQYSGFVNNFETGSHTYCARMIATHNCDPAEGSPVSCDSAAVVLDANTGEQCASLQGKIEPSLLAVYCDKLAKWYNNATLNIERNNHGHAVLLWFQENSNATVMRGPDDRKGWLTNAKGKSLMYDATADAVKDRRVILHDSVCFQQLASIIGGTLKPPETMPADMAIATALAIVGMDRLEPQQWVAPPKLEQPRATPVEELKAAARAGIFGVGQKTRTPFG